MKNHIIYDSCETCKENEFWLDDEKSNLNQELNNQIIAIADIGLWNGRHSGYKMLGNNLNNVLTFFGCDDIVVSYNGKDVISEAYHHDGTHFITFRKIKKGRNICELQDKIYNGTFTDEDVSYYTTSLGKYVKKIYGW